MTETAGAIFYFELWALAFLLPLLVGFSRVFVGAHFPTDVLCGWLLGAVILVLVPWLRRKLPFPKELLEGAGLLPQLIRALRYAAVIFLVIGVYPLLFRLTGRLWEKKAPAEGR